MRFLGLGGRGAPKLAAPRIDLESAKLSESAVKKHSNVKNQIFDFFHKAQFGFEPICRAGCPMALPKASEHSQQSSCFESVALALGSVLEHTAAPLCALRAYHWFWVHVFMNKGCWPQGSAHLFGVVLHTCLLDVRAVMHSSLILQQVFTCELLSNEASLFSGWLLSTLCNKADR